MSSGFEKYVDIDGKAWGPDCSLIHSSVMEKVAQECHTPDALLKTIASLQPRPEGVYLLLNALGAYEYWSSNKNGDAFPEWSLKSMPPPDDVKAIIRGFEEQKKVTLPIPNCCDYGTDTFVKHAKLYQLHENKDPTKAIGDVVAAAYNEYMHRTELIVFIYEARAPILVAAIKAGEPVPFSMGARLPYDVCSICLNIAKNRAEYCDHLKFMLNRILPDGRKVFSYNWFPKFFDISEVRIPADRSAWSLRKVAAFSSQVYDLSILPPRRLADDGYLTKAARSCKLGTLSKEVPAASGSSMGQAPINPELLSFIRNQIDADQDSSKDIIDPQLAEAAKKHGLKEVLSTMSLGGILAKPEELQKLMGITGEDVPDSLALENPSAKLITVLRAHMPTRSLLDPHFADRRKVALASASGVPSEVPLSRDDRYQRYLSLIHRELPSLVKMAHTPRLRVAFEPSWIGSSLFKTGSTVEPAVAWLPFMVAVTKSRLV